MEYKTVASYARPRFTNVEVPVGALQKHDVALPNIQYWQLALGTVPGTSLFKGAQA
jgi:hypothetical protein